jgi:glycosyltransferase involved in cell wall biosynthesis
MRALPLVSIITPTRGRERFLPLLYRCVTQQDWCNLEWLVYDDSPVPSTFLMSLDEPRLHYYHHPAFEEVGAKRNWLVGHAAGEYIVHFDDDDYYSPCYISEALNRLRSNNACLSKLVGLFLYDSRFRRFFYWDQDRPSAAAFACKPATPLVLLTDAASLRVHEDAHRFGYGFSYAYEKRVWNHFRFPCTTHAEDLAFFKQAMAVYPCTLDHDRKGLCVHIIHNHNISGSFPQSVLPSALVFSLFPHLQAHLAGVDAVSI